MKKILALFAVCALGLLASLVMGQDQTQLPPGVAQANWISMGVNVGFVITPNSASPDVLSGYFVAKRENSWKRLDLGSGAKFYPLPLQK